MTGFFKEVAVFITETLGASAIVVFIVNRIPALSELLLKNAIDKKSKQFQESLDEKLQIQKNELDKQLATHKDDLDKNSKQFQESLDEKFQIQKNELDKQTKQFQESLDEMLQVQKNELDKQLATHKDYLDRNSYKDKIYYEKRFEFFLELMNKIDQIEAILDSLISRGGNDRFDAISWDSAKNEKYFTELFNSIDDVRKSYGRLKLYISINDVELIEAYIKMVEQYALTAHDKFELIKQYSKENCEMSAINAYADMFDARFNLYNSYKEITNKISLLFKNEN